MTTPPDDQAIDEILRVQREFFDSGVTRCHRYRSAALGKLEQTLVGARDEIMTALQQDLGKPAVEAYLAEYYFLLQELRLIRKSHRKWLRPKRVGSPVYFQPCRTRVAREPFGLTLVMAPWNYPFQLALSPLIAAVAAGNTVVLKPSEMASASETLLTKIIRDSFQPEHVTVVTGDAGLASLLLGKQFDFIFFTGSTAVGRIVAQQAAGRLIPTVMELGGKCPCVVDKTASIEAAAQRILAGKFFNGGQTCFAPDFVAVHETVKEALLCAFRELMERVEWGPEMARIVNKRHFDRLQKLVTGEVIQQGDDDPAQCRMAPRILPKAQWHDPAMQEEVFGPVLPIVTYQNRDELVTKLKGLGSPLALYLFSEDGRFIEQMMGAVRSGGVCVNDTMKQGSQLNTPFGGVGDSGYGRYRGRAGVEAMSYQRTVVSRPSWAPELFALMPPYDDKIKWLTRFLR